MAWSRFRKKKNIPTGLWVKCPGCDAMLFKKELVRNLHVCGECGHHFPMSARERITATVDHDSFVEESPGLYTIDRLDFVDKEPYHEKLIRSIEKTGQPEGCIYGACTIEGQPLIVAIMDFTFIGGSMGSVVGEKITRAIELATERSLPVIVISASGGARMHEGVLSLMQMAKSSAAIQRHADKGGLYISILTNPTTGGVMASFAALGDLLLAEPGALIGFAGPRVIRETLRTTLPEGFQSSEFLLEHGFIDRIVSRSDMRSTVAKLLGYMGRYDDGQVLPEGSWETPHVAGVTEEDGTEEGDKSDDQSEKAGDDASMTGTPKDAKAESNS